MEINKFYRYEYDKTVEHYLDRINPKLYEYNIVKKTAKGYFINDYGTRRFLLISAKNRFAYETKELAMKGFIRRQRNMILILEERIQVAKAYLKHCLDL